MALGGTVTTKIKAIILSKKNYFNHFGTIGKELKLVYNRILESIRKLLGKENNIKLLYWANIYGVCVLEQTSTDIGRLFAEF